MKDTSSRLNTVPGEIYIEEFISGDEAVKVCDLVVCHGGNGTIYQALRHGKPIIGIPTIPDQYFNMRRVVSLGLGAKVSLKKFNSDPETLFGCINNVLQTPSFKNNAVEFSKKLANLTPEIKAADLIERYFSS